jgi:endonuclease/exonuclease/phosphatase family metal-dependent hydrolase
MDGFKNLFRLNTTEETSLLSEDVISLVETWMTIETTLSGHFSKYNLIQSLAVRESTRGRGKGGVMLLVNKMVFEIRNQSVTRDYIFAKLQHKATGDSVVIATIYVAPLDTEGRIDKILTDLKVWTEGDLERKIVVMGDFNARLGHEDIRSALFQNTSIICNERRSYDEHTNQQGRQLSESTQDADLTILNGRTADDNEGYTFIGPSGASTIDICLCNTATLSLVSSFKVGSWSVSQHLPIHLSLGPEKDSPPLVQYSLRWNHSKRNKYQERMDSSTYMDYDSLIKAIKNVGEELNMVKCNMTRKPWFDSACYAKRRRIIRRLQESRDAARSKESCLLYHKERKEYKLLIREKKASHYNTLRDRVNDTHNPNEFWKAVKSFRPKQPTTNPINEQTWKAFYDDILPNAEAYIPLQGACDEYLDAPFTEDELNEALKKSKTNKASGPDGIPSEFFKNLPQSGKLTMLELFNKIWLEENFPDDWSESTTLMIHKKGDSMSPMNYRPITLLNCVMKIFMQLLTTRLTNWAVKNNILPEEQAGFRRKRGCDDQIFNLTTALQIGTCNKGKVYALFIDFQRAFPSIPHNKLWLKLQDLGVSPKLIRAFGSVYSKCNTRIRLEDKLSDPINVTEGLMQGCVASPLLFTLYIADIVDLLKNSGVSGISLNDLYELHILLFADDTVLLASSARALQLKINLLHRYFKQLGLIVNISKTKVVVFRRGGRLPSNLCFRLGEEVIQIKPQYRYLGVIFSSVFRKASEDAKKKGMKALGSTWSLFCRGKINDWNAHSKLFHSLVASTILYASHIWASDYLDVIEKVQSRFIRRLFHLDFKTPTYALRLETNLPKLHAYVFKQEINFVIRVLQMPDSHLTRISFNALRLTQANDHKRYNWVTGLNDSLKKLNFHNLSESSDYLEWICEKQNTVSSLQSILGEDDLR